MEVHSYLELYLTSIGWKIHGDLFSILVSLGFQFWPFIFIILTNWSETSRSQNGGPASLTAFKRNEFDIYTMFIVVILFFVPNNSTSIIPSEAEYIFQPESDEDSHSVIKSLTNYSGYDPIKQTTAIALPPAWWFFYKLFPGVVYELKSNTIFDQSYSRLIENFSTVKIEDQNLKNEVNDFYTICYSQVLSRHNSSSISFDNAKDANLAYIGNRFFVDTPGYYGHCNSQMKNKKLLKNKNLCMMDWPYSMPKRIADRYELTTASGFDSSGKIIRLPSCREWWLGIEPESQMTGEDYGLRSKLISVSTNGFSGMFSTQEELDAGIYRLLTNSPPRISYVPELEDNKTRNTAEALMDGLAKIGGEVAGGVGTGILALLSKMILEVLKPMLPMIQAVILMTLYLSLPIITLISGYSLKVQLQIVVVMGAIYFFTFLWWLAYLLEEILLRLMYPDNGLADFLTSQVSDTIQDFSWAIFTLVVYIILPSLFVSVLAVAGIKGVDNLYDAASGSTLSDSKKSIRR